MLTLTEVSGSLNLILRKLENLCLFQDLFNENRKFTLKARDGQSRYLCELYSKARDPQ